MSETETLIERLRYTFDHGIFDAVEAGKLATFDEAADELTRLSAENERLREATIDVAASLAAAISLLEKGGKAAKKAAPSDRMFDQMIKDYTASLKRARTALGDAK